MTNEYCAAKQPCYRGRRRSGNLTSQIARRNLTDGQRQVLNLICDGLSYKQISQALKIPTKTVEFHMTNIHRKTETNSIAMIVRWAIRNGIVAP